MTTCKVEATQWVHRYAVGGAIFAALPLPFTTAGLSALEAHMMKMIGEVYSEGSGGIAASAAKGGIALVSQALKVATRRATEQTPKFAAPLIRAAIAGATIEAIGFLLVRHYETKAPGKTFRATRSTSFMDARPEADDSSAGR